MCISLWLCVHVCAGVCACVCVCVCVSVYVCVCVREPLHACGSTCTHMRAHFVACILARRFMYIDKSIHINMYTHTNMYIYIYDREAFRVYLTYAFCIKHMNLFKYFQ